MHTVDIEEMRSIWAKHLGFTPSVGATFDHVSTGFPSRILVGYMNLRQVCLDGKLDEEKAVSIVLDTLLPRRETICGASVELGVIPASKTIWVSDQKKFFFRNFFNFAFDEVRGDFERSLAGLLSGADGYTRSMRREKAMRWYDEFSNLWRNAKVGNDILEARRKLLKSLQFEFRGKQIFHSELLGVEADVLEYLVEHGVNLEECPRADEKGLARIVAEDGYEGEILRRWSPKILDLLRANPPRAITTAPLSILAGSAPLPHYGNDYGMLGEVARWLDLEIPPSVTEDGKNSWPVGTLIEPTTKRRLQGLFSDLPYWGSEEKYLELLKESLRVEGPVFERPMWEIP